MKVSGSHDVVVTQLIDREQVGRLERVVYVCASPGGRAWRADSVVGALPEAPKVEVVAGAGEWVVLHYEYVIGEAFAESESAVNATNGKHFKFWRFSGGMGTYTGEKLEAVKLNAQGQLALITGAEGKPKNEGEPAPTVTRKVVGITPPGKRTVLDTAPAANIPVTSLRLAGGVVHWSDSGVERSAGV